MNRQTQVRSIKIRSRAARLEESKRSSAELTEVPRRKEPLRCFFQFEDLGRHLAVAGSLFLVIVAVKNSTMPEAQSVFSAIQTSVGMEWDESVGKLSFVNSFLPESIRAVWNESDLLQVASPIQGEVVHAWSAAEPYLMIASDFTDVRAAADGEVMSIAHGLNEERIIRIRHDDGFETLYGNLQTCYAEEGERVYAGDVMGQLIRGKPLSFELRLDGRAVDPTSRMLDLAE